MNRRQVCRSLAGLILSAPTIVHAQTARRVRVTWVSVVRTQANSPFLISFQNNLLALGWEHGRNIEIELLDGGGTVAGLAQALQTLQANPPDIVVAAGGPTVRPLIAAGVRAPIVFISSADVAIAGIVDSWSRPGVERTGVSLFSLELGPKRLELLREIFPHGRRVAFVGWPAHAGESLERGAAESAAERLGFEHRYFGVGTIAELDAAFEAISQWRVDALMAFYGGIVNSVPGRFAEFSLRHRILTVSSWGLFAEQGNVLAYGPILHEVYGRLAFFVDRIIKGAKASEIPIERPTRFELVINLRTARTIGLTLPRSLLVRADRTIE